jgi:apolipoprotein N-acyltransferase
VPWLLSLDRIRTARGAALSGLAMSLAYVAAIFAWFGYAIAVYSAGAAAAGLLVLMLSAPLLQPQFLVFALVRFYAGKHYGTALRTLVGACAWVGAEWMFPKLLADSLAHGFYPSVVLRQFGDVAGTAGITFLIVVINECLAAALSRERRDHGLRASLAPLGVAAAITAVMTGYGHWRIAQFSEDPPGEKLTVAMVQSNIAAYDRLRREMGAYEAVRHVLDTHYAMSREAVAAGGIDALLWSETIYPTTFGQPKSDTGGELDREIMDFATSTGVPVVFGTYDRDAAGEYNSAVFLEPGSTLSKPRFDVYRKTRLFLFTEYVPSWMDGPTVRSWIPWAGNWLPGPGAHVLPLKLAGGREVPVQPMICLDDVDASLAIEGARLGAQAILTMSNDSWFTEHTGGAHLHLVVAAFRSIETRLPQLRVTNNGITSVIDPLGSISQVTGVGEKAIVRSEVVPRPATRTLVVRWGDWLGRVGFFVAAALLLAPLLRKREIAQRQVRAQDEPKRKGRRKK